MERTYTRHEVFAESPEQLLHSVRDCERVCGRWSLRKPGEESKVMRWNQRKIHSRGREQSYNVRWQGKRAKLWGEIRGRYTQGEESKVMRWDERRIHSRQKLRGMTGEESKVMKWDERRIHSRQKLRGMVRLWRSWGFSSICAGLQNESTHTWWYIGGEGKL